MLVIMLAFAFSSVEANPGLKTCANIDYALLSYDDGSFVEPDQAGGKYSNFESIFTSEKAVALCNYIKRGWITDGLISGNQYWNVIFVDKSGRERAFTFTFPSMRQAANYVGSSNASRFTLLAKAKTKFSKIRSDLRHQGIYSFKNPQTDYDLGYDSLYEWQEVDAAVLANNQKVIKSLCDRHKWIIRVETDNINDCREGEFERLRKAGMRKEDSAKAYEDEQFDLRRRSNE